MPVPNSQSLVASLLSRLDPSLIGGRQEEEQSPAVRPTPVSTEPTGAETQSAPDFKTVVRANLRAAAQHILRGHTGRSFRECSRPACRNASNLIPYPVVVKPGVTDADLEAIFQRVVTTALEEMAADPAQPAPEWMEEPAFVS
jgi:hypothetical protein